MTRTRTAAVGIALTGAAALGAAALVQPVSAQEEGGLRAATRIASAFADEQHARESGYAAPTGPHACVQSPDGYMGYHYVNPQLVDTHVERRRPEVVLYKQDADGNRVLTGIEYIVVDADQDLATDDDRPSLWGHEFDGPMPGHGPGMPVHYDLHVWTHEENPAGAWESWNTSTDLSCP